MSEKSCVNCKYRGPSYDIFCIDCFDKAMWQPVEDAPNDQPIEVPKVGEYPIKKDAVNHPAHYTQGKYETIDVIEDWKLEYHEANAVKYISRAKHKGKEIEDLKKAKWYLDRKIKLLESKDENNRK